jgi:hypothetical protein
LFDFNAGRIGGREMIENDEQRSPQEVQRLMDENLIKHWLSASEENCKAWQDEADVMLSPEMCSAEKGLEFARLIANRALPTLIHEIELLRDQVQTIAGGSRMMFLEMFPMARMGGGFKACPPLRSGEISCDDCHGEHDQYICFSEYYEGAAERARFLQEEKWKARKEEADRKKYEELKAKYEEGE